jgi:hypothetical protein
MKHKVSAIIFLGRKQNLIFRAVWRIRDVSPGSRILIFTHPGSRISDPGSKNSNKREGRKNFCCQNFLCSHKFHKIAHYFSFDVPKKKIWTNFQRIIELFTQKFVNKLSKIWIWDPRSGIRKKSIPDPGSWGQKGTGSRILDPDPQHCSRKYFFKLSVFQNCFVFVRLMSSIYMYTQPGLRIRIRIIFGSWSQICIRVKSWVRIRTRITIKS